MLRILVVVVAMVSIAGVGAWFLLNKPFPPPSVNLPAVPAGVPALPADLASAREPVPEEMRNDQIVVGKSRKAISNVTRWQYTELAAESPRTATIISDRDDCRQFQPGYRRCGKVRLDAAQQGPKTRAAANGYKL